MSESEKKRVIVRLLKKWRIKEPREDSQFVERRVSKAERRSAPAMYRKEWLHQRKSSLISCFSI